MSSSTGGAEVARHDLKVAPATAVLTKMKPSLGTVPTIQRLTEVTTSTAFQPAVVDVPLEVYATIDGEYSSFRPLDWPIKEDQVVPATQPSVTSRRAAEPPGAVT